MGGNNCGDASLEPLRLVERSCGLTLEGEGIQLCADFTRLIPRIKQDRLHRELLVRAARVKGVESPVAVDATAGLGEDALLLAAAGFAVTMFERDCTIAALLRDAMLRAREEAQLAKVVGRMKLIEGDSVRGLHELGFEPDVVLLDPMFPARKKSAAVKKKLQMIQQLERPCENEGELLQAALDARPRKVVVKRPAKGPCLANAKPSHAITGKAIRYDVYVPRT